MDQKTKNKFGVALGQWVNDPEFEAKFDEEFKEFSLSELLLAIMDEDHKSVRTLANMAGISPSFIQDLRTGKSQDVKLRNFINIVEACGYGVELVKGEKRIPLHPA